MTNYMISEELMVELCTYHVLVDEKDTPEQLARAERIRDQLIDKLERIQARRDYTDTLKHMP